MSADDWSNDHPYQYREILNSIGLKMFMRKFSDMHPVANEFQRKIIMDLADGIIATVLKG